MYKHTFDPNILRSYDIRGIFEKTLNSNDAWMLGYFFGLTIKPVSYTHLTLPTNREV